MSLSVRVFSPSRRRRVRELSVLQLGVLGVFLSGCNPSKHAQLRYPSPEASFHLYHDAYAFPLHRAARADPVKRVESLLDHGARVDEQNGDGDTPLHIAADHCRLDVARVLLAHGAPINARGRVGQTPLHVVTQGRCLGGPTRVSDDWTNVRDFLGLLRLFIDNGAAIDATDREGRTALHLAARCSDAELTRVLVTAGADVNAQRLTGRSPSHKPRTPYSLRSAATCGTWVWINLTAHAAWPVDRAQVSTPNWTSSRSRTT